MFSVKSHRVNSVGQLRLQKLVNKSRTLNQVLITLNILESHSKTIPFSFLFRNSISNRARFRIMQIICTSTKMLSATCFYCVYRNTTRNTRFDNYSFFISELFSFCSRGLDINMNISGLSCMHWWIRIRIIHLLTVIEILIGQQVLFAFRKFLWCSVILSALDQTIRTLHHTSICFLSALKTKKTYTKRRARVTSDERSREDKPKAFPAAQWGGAWQSDEAMSPVNWKIKAEVVDKYQIFRLHFERANL